MKKSTTTILSSAFAALFVIFKFICNSVQNKSIESEEKNEAATHNVLESETDESQQAHFILKKSLLQLEFISIFEAYLEDESFQDTSLEFLHEFEEIKRQAQINTLRFTNKLLCA